MKEQQIEQEIMQPISVPFMHVGLESDDNVLEEQRKTSEKIVEENPEGYGANWANRCGSWNSTNVYDNILTQKGELFSSILDNIGELVTDYTNAMSMDWSDMTPYVTESWLNANPPGNVQECHTHAHCYISAVYYIHVPDAGGSKFVLNNPLSYEHNVGCSHFSPYADKTVDVTNGDLILFPSNIEHHTEVNKSDEFRYSLAFNISTEELLPQYMVDGGPKPW